jgi:DNA-binding MarR family transcriptional regulator
MEERGDAGSPAPATVELADVPLDPDVRELTGLIIRLTRQMRAPNGEFPAELQTRLAEQGLARRHLATLIAIAVHEPLTVGQLAEHLALSPATASQLVSQLDRGGFLERREDHSDRRRVIVALQPRDRRLIQPLAHQRLGAIDEALRAMAPAEREQFMAGWRLLVHTLERRPGSRPERPDPETP